MVRAASTVLSQPQDNYLFAALPHEDAERLLPHLMPVRWTLGTGLAAPHQTPAYLYFPTTALVSLVYTTASGQAADIGVVGHDGVVGTTLFMGGATMPHEAIVRIAGEAFGLPVTVLQAEFQRGGAFREALLRYTQALLTQLAQAAVCNGRHPVMARLCRWLLCLHDQVPADELCLTHEVLAQMVGTRRESITLAAQHLYAVGVLRYTQGRLTIVDRQGLEALACECYAIVRDTGTRRLGRRTRPSFYRSRESLGASSEAR